ncbi:DUF4440 domain-containing protein [Acidobacteria bacterium AB60]|nr:DUF4440 domain-containing protein [Acidobacteria bacterium AB60]
MSTGPHTFSTTSPDLRAVLEELKVREPIFHAPGFGSSPADWERSMAPDYWEVGASGRRYSRAFILRHLQEHPPADAEASGWQTRDHSILPLGPDTYLITYTLHQPERITRRATIWQRTGRQWRILYHQGTIVTAGEDDAVPA